MKKDMLAVVVLILLSKSWLLCGGYNNARLLAVELVMLFVSALEDEEADEGRKPVKSIYP